MPSDFATLLSLLESAPELREATAVTFYRGLACLGARTYPELCAQARSVASALRALGVRAGDRVALLSQNSVEVPAVVLGALCAGAVLVPLNAAGEASDWSYVLEHAAVRQLLV